MMTTATMAAPTSAPPSDAALLDQQAADVLSGRICSYAARQARASCDLLIAVGEFDAGRGWGWSDGIKSSAHWLAWACSMTPGTAREHIRVARALHRMPTVTAAFTAGQLSSSKVREVTRVVGSVDEAELCQLARYATASQLARTVAGFRAAASTLIRAEERRVPYLGTRGGTTGWQFLMPDGQPVATSGWKMRTANCPRSKSRAASAQVRKCHADYEERQYGRSWTPAAIMLGLVGDVGDVVPCQSDPLTLGGTRS